jgi:hypothetical protein
MIPRPPSQAETAPQPSANPKPIRLRKWSRVQRNTLRGFADLTVPGIGLDIDDVAIHEKGGRRWASLPARPMIDANGVTLRDEKGKVRYSSPLRWLNHGLAARFGERVVALVLKHRPRGFRWRRALSGAAIAKAPGAFVASIETAAALRVTDADARNDRAWFSGHPDRLFRARASDGGIWLIRRRPQGGAPDVYLRTFSPTSPVGDSDGALAVAWWTAAYPSWPLEQALKWARKALKKGSRR